MEVKDWTKRELEKLYVNIFIIEETYVRKNEEIKKQKIYVFIGLNLKGDRVEKYIEILKNDYLFCKKM